MSNSYRAAVVAAAALLSAPVVAQADPATYTMSAYATGSLDGVAFTDALVTLVGQGDTSNRTQTGPGYYQDQVAMSVTVAGIGSDVFMDPSFIQTADDVPLVVFDTDLTGGYFNYTSIGDLLGVESSSLSSYDLESSVVPVTDVAEFNAGGWTANVQNGTFEIDAVDTATFGAIVTSTSVPEPASLAVLAVGMAATLLRRRRRA